MRKLFPILLAVVYVATTFGVLFSQTEAAGDDVCWGRLSDPSVNSAPGLHWASDPHFSHAKKIDPGLEWTTTSTLYFAVPSVRIVQQKFDSVHEILQTPRPARAPPLVS